MLCSIKQIYITPLRKRNVIAPERLESFISDVFYNYQDVLSHARRLLTHIHEIQREEHPLIRSTCASVLDAALNWRDAYMEYIPHYPIAEYRMKEELQNNPAFKEFYDVRRIILGCNLI